MNMPHLRYVHFSYSSGLTERDNLKFKKLVTSERYRELWGDRFDLEKEGEIKITNNKTGSKFASSVKGIGTGERGDRVVIDDPHDVHKSESEVVRTDTVRWFRETITDRLNHLDDSAILIIMQRVHQLDISGFILDQGWEYSHLMIPMEFETGRQPFSQIGWKDPREEDGDLAWPERFSPQAVAKIEQEKGSFAYAGQYQQRPAPRGGGIIPREHWRAYTPDTCGQFGMVWPKLPHMSYTLMSIDTAQTEKKQNDPSAAVILGVCKDVYGRRAVILMWAWAERLELYDLIKKIEESCKKFKVNRLLVEAKASGHPVAQEIRRRSRAISDHLAVNPKTFEHSEFGIQLIEPDGDKVARMFSVQNLFECGLVWAPAEDSGGGDYLYKVWADKTITECQELPKGATDDLADCISQGLKYLRDLGLAQLPDEDELDELDPVRYPAHDKPMYPAVG